MSSHPDDPRATLTESPTAPGADAGRKGRVRALDGLRGLIIVSVVVNHAGGILWPRGAVYDIPVLRGLLGGGAVVVFFVVGAFIVTHNLLRDRARGTLDPLRFFARRMIRLGVQLVPLSLVLVVLHLYDDTVRGSTRSLVQNILHLQTHTLNLFGERDLLSVRPEVGHLWYLSVQQQCYLLLPLAIVLLARWRTAFLTVLALLMALVYLERQQVLDERGWVIASTLTTTRADGLIWGVGVAVALPLLTRVPRPDRVLWISLSLLLALKLVLLELPPLAYLGPWSIWFTLVSGVVVAAIWSVQEETRVRRWLSWSPFTWLGKASLSIFIWHFPVIMVVSRHTPTWGWPARTLLALAVLAVIVVVLEKVVEEPTRRFLATTPTLRLAPSRPQSPGPG